MNGKPYSGKPNVRFDEGELEIELMPTTPALYSTVLIIFERCVKLLFINHLEFTRAHFDMCSIY